MFVACARVGSERFGCIVEALDVMNIFHIGVGKFAACPDVVGIVLFPGDDLLEVFVQPFFDACR
jgi:hypothetical protein